VEVGCQYCGELLDEETLRKLILRRLQESQEEARANKEHISHYARFAIREEIIDAFTDAKED